MYWYSSNETYREACRRNHRLLAAYLAWWCWDRKVDCVAIPRYPFMTHLGLERLRRKRFDWIITDVQPLFPHPKKLSWGGRTFATLYLSQRRYPKGAFDEALSNEKRVLLLRHKGLHAAIIRKLPNENTIKAKLANLVGRLQDFTMTS